MKKLIGLLPIAAAALLMTSCGSKTESNNDLIDLLPVQLEQGGNWSFLTPEGTLKYEDEFKNQPSCVVNGFFGVEESGGYTLYKAGDKPEAVGDLEGLFALGTMNDGVIPFTRPKGRIALADKNGKEIAQLMPVDGKEITECAGIFKCGLARVNDEEYNYGYIDTKGNVAIGLNYKFGFDFSEDKAVVQKDDQYMVIDKKGKTLFKFKKGWSLWNQEFSYGVLALKDANDKIMFVNEKGEEVSKCPAKVINIGQYNDKYYVFYDGDSYGLMSRKDNEVLIRAKYENIAMLENGDLLCRKNDKVEVLTPTGDEKFALEDYNYVLDMGKFGLFGAEKKTFVLLDKEGKPVKNMEFRDFTMQISPTGYVTSDYFDMKGMAGQMAKFIIGEGMGKFILDKPASTMVDSPENKSYVSEAEIESASGKGYKYSYSAKGYFTEPIAKYDYDYDNYSGKYSFNPESKLQSYFIFVNADTQIGDEGVKAIVKDLEAKGFTSIASKYGDSGESQAALKKGSRGVVILGNDEHIEIRVGTLTDEDAKKLKAHINNEPYTAPEVASEESYEGYDGD